jgi:osmotically-inducible protein OsmY
MARIALFLLGTLCMLGCSRNEEDKTGTTRLTGATVKVGPTAEEIRLMLNQAKPNDPEVNAFLITDEGGLVTIRGMVPDEQTHADIVRRIKGMPNVTGVRDDLQVPEPTPASDAVRSSMMREQPTSATVVQHLIISDDGTAILVQGVVPDETTHDALLKSAQKASGGESVTDDMRVQGK